MPGANDTRIVHIDGIRRGMIFWVDVPGIETRDSEQYHDIESPWLVVSADVVHQRLPIVQAIPLSTKLHKADAFRGARIRILASQIVALKGRALELNDQLALTEQLRVLAHQRLNGDPAAIISDVAMMTIEAAIKYVMGIRT